VPDAEDWTAQEGPAEEDAPAWKAEAAPDPVAARLDALESHMGELRGFMAGLAEQAAAQAQANRTVERMIDELAGEVRQLPSTPPPTRLRSRPSRSRSRARCGAWRSRTLRRIIPPSGTASSSSATRSPHSRTALRRSPPGSAI
jgi:hypothetical protein